jgi:hypothetical protein
MSPPSSPLAIALLTHRFAVQGWQADVLTQLAKEGRVQVTHLIAITDDDASGFEQVFRLTHSLIQSGLGRHGEALRLMLDTRHLFSGAASQHATRADLSRFGAALPAQVDVIIDCGVGAPFARLLQSRLGTLAFSFAGAPGDLGLFRTLIQGERNFRLTLSLFKLMNTTLLAEARPALPERGELHDAGRTVYRRAATMLRRALRELGDGEDRETDASAEPSSAPPVGVASAWAYGARKGAELWNRGLNKLRPRSRLARTDRNWFLAYRTNPNEFVRNNDQFQAQGLRLVIPPEDRFYADPCVIRHGGTDHVFIEEQRLDQPNGFISCMSLRSGRLTAPEPVLERPHHLSYPFVFQSGNDVFMIPESGAARRVSLFRARRFPYDWEEVEVLLEGVAAVDATVVQLDSRWWMFVNVGEDGSSKWDQLHLYYADRPQGPWLPHRRNPVKIDVTSSRPAGPLFQRQGKWLRPTQDCSQYYGGALTLCELRKLSTSEYAEVEVQKLLPSWLPSNVGFHTLSSSDGLEVIDGNFRRGARPKVTEAAVEAYTRAATPTAAGSVSPSR